MALTDFTPTVFLLCVFGSYIYLVQGVPNRDFGKDPSQIGSTGPSVKYEIISRAIVTQPNVFKECDTEGDCEPQGSGDTNEEKIPVKKRLPVLQKELTLIDAFFGRDSNTKDEDTKYEIIFKSIAAKESDSTSNDAFKGGELSKRIKENKENDNVVYEIISMKNQQDKNCDDEDECGSADDVFSNEDSGEKIVRGLSPQKTENASTEETAYYEVVSKSMVNKEESKPADAFTSEETSENENNDVKYEIIFKSLSKEGNVPSKKNCDDEDECGSGDDALSNEDSSTFESIKGLSPPEKKSEQPEKATYYEVLSQKMENNDLTPVDIFAAKEIPGDSSNREDENVKYEIIFTSTDGVKAVSKSMKECDDEDECAGSGDEFFSNEDGGDKIIRSHFSAKDKESLNPVFEIISKETKRGRDSKSCDDEDECGSADDAYENEGSGGDKTIRGFSSPKEEGSLTGETFYEVISKKTSNSKDLSPPDAFAFEEKDAATYEIMSKTMETKNSIKKRCGNGKEDCQTQEGGKDDMTVDYRRVVSPPKYEVGPQVSVESSASSLFGGSSFLELPPLGKDAQDNIDVEMEIFPLEKTGLLLYNGWEPDKIGDFFSLFIKDGWAELSFDCRSGPAKVRAMKPIKINEWNKIKLFRTGRLGSVTVNDEFSAIGLSPEPRSALTLHQKLLVAGMPREMRSEVHLNVGIDRGFTGYIRNLKIQGRVVDISLGSISESENKNPCGPSPCQNGGECVVSSDRDYHCTCEAPYHGRNCEKVIDPRPISFHRHSYVRFKKAALLKILQGQEGAVTFSIQTTQSRGLLLWEEEKLTKSFRRYASVGLKVGFVSLSFNLGTGKRQIHSTVFVNDAKWHKITIARGKGPCKLIIDEKHKTTFNSFGRDLSMKTSIDLYVGGVPNIKTETRGIHKSGFNGCLKNLRINSKHIDFTRDYVASQGTGYCSDT